MVRLVKFLIFSVILILVGVTAARAQSFAEVYQNAQTAYYEKNHQQAAALWQSLLADHAQNGPLWYNLGNAHYQMGELAQARRDYEKAKIVMPRFANLRANLELLHADLPWETTLSPAAKAWQTLYLWMDWLTVGEAQAVTITLVVALCGTWAYRRWRRLSGWRLRLAVFFVLCVYLACGTTWLTLERQPGRYAIVLTPDAALKASYLEKAAPILTLRAGDKVEIIDTQNFSDTNQWVRLRLPNGQSGWALHADVGEI